MKPTRASLVVLAASFLSGILMQLSMPPVCWSYLSLVAMLPLASAFYRPCTGVIVFYFAGLFLVCGWFIISVWAFRDWGRELALAPILLIGSLTGIYLALAKCIANAINNDRYIPIIFLVAWWTMGITAEALQLPSPTIVLPFALDSPGLISSVSVIGARGLDSIIVLFNFFLVRCVSGGGADYSAVSLPIAAVLALCLPKVHPDDSGQSLNLAIIQPSVESHLYNEARWSIYSRAELESHIDELIGRAIQLNLDLVVMPEGGNDLYNLRLERRLAKMRELMHGSAAYIALSGRDLTPLGYQRNVVSIFKDGAHQRTIAKSILIPFVERSLSSGREHVVKIHGKDIGFSICYEGIFASHFARLVKEGAQGVVVSTNDVAFNTSSMEKWHLAYAVLRGVEFGRSIAFVSNYGTNVVTDIYGNRILESHGKRGPSVLSSQMQLYGGKTPYSRYKGLVDILVGGMFAALLLHSILRGISLSNTVYCRTIGHFIAAALLAIPFFGTAVAVSVLFHPEIQSKAVLREYADSLIGRQKQQVQDNLSPLFKQSQPRNCGAAAAAFALTYMGSYVFESDVLAAVPMSNEQGYSLLELKQFIEQNHFSVDSSRKGDFIRTANSHNPIIVHLSFGHFVVVLDFYDKKYMVFDPAIGAVSFVGQREFEAETSGYSLKVITRNLAG